MTTSTAQKLIRRALVARRGLEAHLVSHWDLGQPGRLMRECLAVIDSFEATLTPFEIDYAVIGLARLVSGGFDLNTTINRRMLTVNGMTVSVRQLVDLGQAD